MGDNATAGWFEIKSLVQKPLQSLFDDNVDRLEQFSTRFSVGAADIFFDFSKTHLDAEAVAAFERLADATGFEEQRTALFAGEPVNNTEGRAAEHMAERGEGNPQAVAHAKQLHRRMARLVDAINDGAMGEIRHVLHIGIGGSALGPKLMVDALGRDEPLHQVHVVANVDGTALEEAFKLCDPATTLVAVASKTFTTTETLMNAQSALQWLNENGVDDAYGRIIALTAAPDKAVEWGVDETRVLPFSETVGGRYSIWSTIGFPIAMAIGNVGFEEMLRGAAAMDRHFRDSEPAKNIPLRAAFVDLYYAQNRNCQTRAVFAYDERLRLLPDYLQQLEMESNGKSVTRDGETFEYPSAPITWGGVGTDAQHAVFQLLHQGTHLIPVEFIASLTPGHDLDAAHHRALLVNCFAQGAALMAGKHVDDPARSYAGDRPSTTILLEDVDPASLGALIAFYEHRTFANAVLLGINPFDQFGVELGKSIAKAIESGEELNFDPSTQNLITMADL